MTTIVLNPTTQVELSGDFSDKEVNNIKRLLSLPDAAMSEPAKIVAVYKMNDRVMVACSDNKIRTIVTRTVNLTFNSSMTTDQVFNRLQKRVNQEVVFFATSVNGRAYSPDVYFIGIVSV